MVISLKPEDYADDVEVRVHCAGQEVWLSERLFRRLVLIGRAYECHLLPFLEQDVSLNPVQADGLLGELDLVATLVSDAALMSTLDRLAPLATACRRSASAMFVEWP
jgi:hypothetical protein